MVAARLVVSEWNEVCNEGRTEEIRKIEFGLGEGLAMIVFEKNFNVSSSVQNLNKGRGVRPNVGYQYQRSHCWVYIDCRFLNGGSDACVPNFELDGHLNRFDNRRTNKIAVQLDSQFLGKSFLYIPSLMWT